MHPLLGSDHTSAAGQTQACGPPLGLAQLPKKLSEQICSLLLSPPHPLDLSAGGSPPFSPLSDSEPSPSPPQHPIPIPPAPAPPAGCQDSSSSKGQCHGRASSPHRGPSALQWVPLWLPSSCQRSQPKKIISSPGWGRGSLQSPCPSPPCLPGWPHCLLF